MLTKIEAEDAAALPAKAETEEGELGENQDQEEGFVAPADETEEDKKRRALPVTGTITQVALFCFINSKNM